jgi:hypothetical protein
MDDALLTKMAKRLLLDFSAARRALRALRGMHKTPRVGSTVDGNADLMPGDRAYFPVKN